jgi:hypothetical protein
VPTYRVELQADLPGLRLPSVDVVADNPIRAAALGLSELKRQGAPLPVDGTLDVNGQTFIFDAVFAWLAEDREGQAFAEREGLTGLSFW